MKLHALLASTLLALSFLSASAQNTPEKTPMEKSMEALDAAFKEVRKALRAPDAAQKEQYLKWVETIKTEAAKCKDLVPKKIAELPTDQQAPLIEAYKKDMDKFITAIDSLGKALSEEKWADAEAIIKDMGKQKSSGHEQYKKEE